MNASKKIWIDLDNSPHVPFFRPIIEELTGLGYGLLVTVRDAFQVCDLAESLPVPYLKIGHHYGKNKFLKVAGLLIRSAQLTPAVLKEKPDLAVSHGSRSQLLLARILGIHSIVIMDYEHAEQLLYPDWVFMPEVIRDEEMHLNGKNVKVLRYPGLKEDVYAPSFRPDPKILQGLGVEEDEIVVTIRPPATEAHYHNPESEQLFDAVVDLLGGCQKARMVILPRNKRQDGQIKARWPSLYDSGKIIIPAKALDGLNLIWHSDLVISGGGTMNREAAALGVPVYSIFRGKLGAVDRNLSMNGRLILLKSVEDVRIKLVIQKRDKGQEFSYGGRKALRAIVDGIVGALERQT